MHDCKCNECNDLWCEVKKSKEGILEQEKGEKESNAVIRGHIRLPFTVRFRVQKGFNGVNCTGKVLLSLPLVSYFSIKIQKPFKPPLQEPPPGSSPPSSLLYLCVCVVFECRLCFHSFCLRRSKSKRGSKACWDLVSQAGPAHGAHACQQRCIRVATSRTRTHTLEP